MNGSFSINLQMKIWRLISNATFKNKIWNKVETLFWKEILSKNNEHLYKRSLQTMYYKHLKMDLHIGLQEQKYIHCFHKIKSTMFSLFLSLSIAPPCLLLWNQIQFYKRNWIWEKETRFLSSLWRPLSPFVEFYSHVFMQKYDEGELKLIHKIRNHETTFYLILVDLD